MDPPPHYEAPQPFIPADAPASTENAGKQHGMTKAVVDALLDAIPRAAHPS
jgi:hypothetical protein